jgi:hypothetical protein
MAYGGAAAPHERFHAVFSEAWAKEMEREYERYMERLYAHADRDLWDHDMPEDGDGLDVTGQPFCGCEVCDRRASWAFLMTWTLAAAAEGVAELEEVGGGQAPVPHP